MRRATPKSLWRTKSEYPETSCLAFYAMLATSNALRLHVESALAGRVASPFRFQEPQPVTASTGISAVDQIAGGLPRGCLTEVFGGISSGITSLLQAALAARTANAEVCALVDAQDSFNPGCAQFAGISLQQLLWVRCRNVDQALRSVDLVPLAAHGGKYFDDSAGSFSRVECKNLRFPGAAHGKSSRALVAAGSPVSIA